MAGSPFQVLKNSLRNARPAAAFGVALLMLLVSVSYSFAGADMTVFGPKRYDRLKGKPTVYTDTFERCNPSDLALVRVQNGDSKNTRIKSARIYINGSKIAGESEFKHKIATFEKLVAVQQLNELKVILKSGHHGYFDQLAKYQARQSDLEKDLAKLQLLENEIAGLKPPYDIKTLERILLEFQRIKKGYGDRDEHLAGVRKSLDDEDDDADDKEDGWDREKNGHEIGKDWVEHDRTGIEKSKRDTEDAIRSCKAALDTFDRSASKREKDHEKKREKLSELLKELEGINHAIDENVRHLDDLARKIDEIRKRGPSFLIIEIIGKGCDSTPPVISAISPADGALLNNPLPVISASYSDETNGSGINTASVRLLVDGNDVSAAASITAAAISYAPGSKLPDGSHAVSLSVADRAANVASRIWSFVTDTVPPVVTISAPASGLLTRNSKVTVTGTVSEDVTAVTVNNIPAQVNGKDWTLVDYTLSEGANSITVQATDRTGNPGSATVNVTLDSTPPAAPLLNPLTTPTNLAAVTISGTAEADASVKVVAGGVIFGTVPADAEGKFSLGGATLVEGINTYTAAAIDAAGNESSASSPVSAVLDITPPVIIITAPTANAFLNTPQITVTGMVNEPVTSVTVNNTSAVVDGLSFSLTITLAEGANTLVVKAKDLAGNEGTTSVPVYLDTTPPQVTIVTPAAGLLTRDKQVIVSGTVSEEFTTVTVNTITATVSGKTWSAAYTLSEEANFITVKATDRAGNSGSATVNVTLDSTPPQAPVLNSLTSPTNVAGVTLGGTAEAGSSVKISAAGLLIGTVTADAQGSFTLAGVTLAEGTNSYTAIATDAAGNESIPSVPLGIVLDTRAPVITVTVPAENAFFSAPQVTVKGNIDEPVAGLTINGQAATLSSLDFDQPLTLTPGLNTITLVATDLAGNQATKTVLVTLDNTPPVVTITAPLSGTITKTAQVTVSGIISKPHTTATINGTAITVTNQTFSVVYTLAEGDNILNIEATDRAGNKGSASVGVSLDSQSPVLSLQSPAEAAAGANVAIVVNVSDNRQLTLVELKADGVPIWSGGNIPSIVESVSYKLSPSLNTGSEVVFQARGIDVAGNEGSATTRVKISQAAMGPGYVQGKVLEDERGLLLADAQVTVTDENGEVKTLTTAADGGYFTENQSGNAVVGVIKPGFTSVERIVPVMPEKKATALDARLTKINGTKNVIDAIGGTIRVDVGAGLPRPAIELTIPNGALSNQADIRLTPVSNQGLAGMLPPGWSPLAAVDVRLLDPTAGTALYTGFSSAAALKIPVQVPLAQASGTVLTLAAYDSTSHQWRSKGNATIAADGLSASADITAAGQYALLIADPAPNAPAAAEAGNPLAPASTASLDYAAINTAGKVVPQASPPSTGLKAAGEVLLTAKDGVTPAPQFISGFIINNRVTEKFDLKSGDKVEPSAYTQDIVLYRQPCITNIAAGALTQPAVSGVGGGVSGVELRTTFPVSPSRDFTLVDLLLGKVGIEIVKPDATDSGIMVGADGGRLVDADGNILVIPQGALARTTPVATKNGAAATGAVGNDFTLLKVVEVNLTRQTLAQSATISIPAPDGFNPSLPLLVAKQIDVKGVQKLKLVALARQNGSFITTEPLTSQLQNSLNSSNSINSSGVYYFLQAKGQIGFATGTVTDSSNAPFNGALVKTDNGSLIDLSAATGKYLVAAPVAAVTATATDLYKNDEGSATGAIAANQAIIIDLKILMILPTVVSVSPTGINIQPNVPVVITFSKSMDQSSINSQTLKLLDSAGTAVPGVFTFSVDGKVVTFTPADLLKSQQSYTITIAGTIKDLQGYPLGQDVTSGFTIRNTTPPPMPPAGSITASFPDADGFISITATQGSSPADCTVLIINDTSGEIVSVVPAGNGSFTGKVRGQLGDEIKIVIMDNSGNQTLVSYLTFKSDDGNYLVTAKGGKVEGEGGSILDIPEGALSGPTIVKLTFVPEASLASPVPAPGTYLSAFNIDTGGIDFQKEVHLSMPLPDGFDPTTPVFVNRPSEIYNADGTIEKVYEIIDSTKVINNRITTASPPFTGIVQIGSFAFISFGGMKKGIVSGYTYQKMNDQTGYQPPPYGVIEIPTFDASGNPVYKYDRPIKGAVIRTPDAWDYVSYSNSSGFYAGFATLYAYVVAMQLDYRITAIHPLTMRRTSHTLFMDVDHDLITNLNFMLADKNSIPPDKTAPVIDLTMQVAPGQAPTNRISSGTMPLGTEVQLPLFISDQSSVNPTLTVEYKSPEATTWQSYSAPLIRLGAVLSSPPTADKPAIWRYTFKAVFPAELQGSQDTNCKPGLAGNYRFTVEATDTSTNKSTKTLQLRVVAVGAIPGGVDGAPTVDSIAPADGAKDLPVTTQITAWFSEPVENVTPATFKLIDTSNGRAMPAIITTSYEGGRMQAVLTPRGNLSYDRQYQVQVLVLPAGGIVDINPNPSADNAFLPLAQGYQSTFTTKRPAAYDLAEAEQFKGGRDIALYNHYDGNSYAYIAADDQGWHVADVSDPTNPSVVYSKSMSAPAVSWSYRGVAVHPAPTAGIMAMTENIVFGDGNQYGYIRFYDIKTDPVNPAIIGKQRLAEAYSGIPGRLALAGEYAYIATAAAALQVVSISKAKDSYDGFSADNPSIVGVFDSIGQGYGSPNDIAVYGTGKALLTTTAGYLITLDINNPTPVQMGVIEPKKLNALRVAGVSDYSYADADGNPQSMDLALTGGGGRLKTVDLTDPYNPQPLATVKDALDKEVVSYPYDITLNKETGLAIVSTLSAIQVVDVKDPKNPRLINTITQLPNSSGATTPEGSPAMIPIGTIPAMAEKDGWLYMADQTKGMRTMGINTNDIRVYNESNIQVPEIGYSKGGEDDRRYYVEVKYEDPDINCNDDDLVGSMVIKTRKGAVVNPLPGIDHPTQYLLSFRKGSDEHCYADLKKTITSPTNKRFIATNFPAADLKLTTPDGMTIAPVFGSIGTKAIFEFSSRKEGRLMRRKSIPLEKLIRIAFDGNRDGVIDFKNPEDRKYTFWVNDDNDVNGYETEYTDINQGSKITYPVEDDNISGTVKDCVRENGDKIKTLRDLEDFARVQMQLHPHARKVMEILSNQTTQPKSFGYYLKFNNTNGTSPEINIFQAVGETEKYLWNENSARKQLDKPKLLTISSTESELAPSYISTDKTSPYIFEGRNFGKGELTFILKADGDTLEENSALLELKPIQTFYDKFRVTYDEGSKTVGSQVSEIKKSEYPAKDKDYLLFVHGWNMQGEIEKDRWAETIYKRLWWQGYTGRVGSFSWPTLEKPYDIPRGTTFDRSELRAWNSSEALKDVLEIKLRDYAGNIRLLGHSMGGIVSGEAIQKLSGPGIVKTYIPTQAALSSHFYDNSVTESSRRLPLLPVTPNVFGYYYSGNSGSQDATYLADSTGKAKFINYFNEVDYALTAGERGFMAWEFNTKFRPDPGYLYCNGLAVACFTLLDPLPTIPGIISSLLNSIDGGSNYYVRLGISNDGLSMPSLLKFPADRYEIFSRIIQSRVKALGATSKTPLKGFEKSRNLKKFGYDDKHYSHSKEFRSNIVDEQGYWKAIFSDFELKSSIEKE
ncbi:Ig-like domain-containing protein [Geotalea uraniireducens]|uniref:Ig-like domain-containing protein n=1 Tax=Geotalea uraniireducens (strain Rf4) TaxID=351605 RepID=A5G5X6_GEOUR|nr:Ig-like domain-containing protein [Geotalea uraniireducens]ABQ27194.1 hypothetical protein Gura_3022 [Geotalea uraniireducens Rf4]